MVGPLLVLFTWLVCLIGIVALGLPVAHLVGPRQSLTALLRTAIWWGLLVATLLVLSLNVVVPLRSATAAAAVVAAVVLLGATGVLLWWRGRDRGGRHRRAIGLHRRWWLLPLLGAIALALGYLALSALGPVTNYDSGLYHLGAVRYAADYSTIPGLANLYFPFGYSNSAVPMAAFLGNGPWDGDGFRLFNGLLIVLMGVDVALRLLRRRHTVGTYVMVVGLAASWVPLIALADYWVTSPTSDSAVLVLTVVACAYLTDALVAKRSWQPPAAVALATCVLLVSMRPLMAVFSATLLAVIVIGAVRRRRRGEPAIRSVVVAVVAAGALLMTAVQSVRDYILSGWLQYPIGLVSFDVPWLAPDPSGATRATLGAARDAGRLWTAADGWSWIPTWIGRLPRQWETYLVLALVLVCLVALIVARRITGSWPRRAVLLAMAPSAVTVVVWWVATPPAFRFVWGPLFMLAAIPLGFSLHAIAANGRVLRTPIDVLTSIGLAAILGVLVVYCSLVRLDLGARTQERVMALGPISVVYVVAPVPVPQTSSHPAQGGVVLRLPVGDDRCWDAWPMCVGLLPVSLSPRGPSIQDGFVP